jgi:2-aminoethylphosphonate-pyruvate transaminase
VRRLLFTPGPTNVHPSVREALLVPDMSHREPAFATMLERLCGSMVQLFGGAGTHGCVPFVSSGTGANEAILAGVEGKLLLLDNGRYARRIGEIATRQGVDVRVLASSPTEPIDPRRVRSVLADDPDIRHIFVVHLETTTGLLAPLRALGEIAHAHECQLLVDCISSIGGHEFDLSADHVAFCSVNANKCLEGLPGISFVLGRTDLIQSRAQRSRSVYFDLYEQWRMCTQERETPYTASVQLLSAADTAVARLVEETVVGRMKRYRELRDQLRQGLLELDLELAPFSEASQSNILSHFRIPPGASYAALQRGLNQRGAIVHTHQEIVQAGYLAVATMGHLGSDDVAWFLAQLDDTLRQAGVR